MTRPHVLKIAGIVSTEKPPLLGRAARTAKKLGAIETFQEFATRVMVEAMRIGELTQAEIVARMKPQEILIERNFLLGQSAESLAAQLAYDHWHEREGCQIDPTSRACLPPSELHVLDRRGGITAVVRELLREGRKVQSKTWYPGTILKTSRKGSLVETETGSLPDGTIVVTGLYRVLGYGFRVVATFDGKTGKRTG